MIRTASVAVICLAAFMLLVTIAVQMHDLAPLRKQPFRLSSTSEISGEMSISLINENPMTFETTVSNVHGIPNTIRTDVAGYPDRAAAEAAHTEAINSWLANDTAGAPPK